MLLPLPAEEKIFWTKHSKNKMRHYNLSERRVLRILRKPERREEGIVPRTIAAMQVAGTKRRPTEVWMMYQVTASRKKGEKPRFKRVKVISAWRYPGRTPLGERPVIPEDVLRELSSLINN